MPLISPFRSRKVGPKRDECAFTAKRIRQLLAADGDHLDLETTGGWFMNLTISGHHLDVTPALRNYVMEKLQRVLRHFDQVIDVKVLLSVRNESEKEKRQRAECNLRVKGSDLYAGSSHFDLYAAVDELVDKLDRQVVKHKTRLQERRGDSVKREVAAISAA